MVRRSRDRASKDLLGILELLLELVDLVLQLPHLLVGEGLLLLAVLQLLLDILDGLLGILGAQGLLRLHVDLVAGAVVYLIRSLVALLLVLVLLHRLALDSQVAALHDPLLSGDIVAELLVVRDDQDAALVVLDGKDQGTQALAIQIVRGLVEDQDVGVLPHRGSQHDLDLHAAAELVDLGVACRLGVHAEVAEVLLDGGLRELLGHEAGHGCLPLVLALHELQVAHLNEDLLLYPDIALDGLELPLHLVLVGLLLLLLPAVKDGVGNHGSALVLLGLLSVLLGVNASAAGAGDGVDAPLLRTGLLLVHGELRALELDALLVVIAREAPHDVLRGRLLHVLLQVVESVLRDVGHAQARGLPDAALRRLLLAHEDLDGRGLARAVGTDHGHAAHLRDRQAHVHDRGLVLGGVLEGHIGHAQHDLAAALHALHGAGLREGELHDLVAQLEVRLLLGVLLHELGEGLTLRALEGLELPVLEVDDVGAHLVQEGREVRGADDAAGEGLEPVLEPLDVVHVQVARGFVKHEHVGVHELGRAELHLHLPATRVGGHRVLQVGRAVGATGVTEAGVLHELLDRVLGDRVLDLVDVIAGVLHPPPARLVHAEDGEAVILHADLLVLNLVLNEHALELVALGEALQLLVGDGTHQRGLAALVRAQEAVEAVALQVHLGVAEQREGTVGQREGALVEVHALGVLILDLLLLLPGHLQLRAHVLANLAEWLEDANGLRPVPEAPHVRGQDSQGRGVVEGCLGRSIAAELVAQGSLEGGHGVGLRHGLVLRALGRLEEGLHRALGHAASLRIGDLLDGLLHEGLQKGHHRQHRSGVLHDLAHVVHDEAAGALHLLGLVVEAAGEHGHHDGERRGLDVLHEHAARQPLDALVRLVDGLRSLDHCIKEGVQVLVASAGADGSHALGGGGLDLLLDVACQLGHGGDKLHELEADGLGKRGGQLRNELQGGLLLGRLGLDTKAGQQRRQHGTQRVGAEALQNSLRCGHGGVLHVLRLVASGLQDLVVRSHEERLRRGALVLGKLGEPLQRRLALLLVADLCHKVVHLALQRGGHRAKRSGVNREPLEFDACEATAKTA
mmetsp:Transcript_9350/g.21219  ORF Transcript_9350/g.21219 Transcript_9350/m.21219 type:complete len:1082 (+) Transcript_9350:301-3546(+)